MSGPGVIAVEDDRRCELCGTVAECRPYGPKGEQVCWTCGMKDKEAAERGVNKYIFGVGNA